MVKQKRALGALLLVVGILSLAALACTSDQEWLIPRTATPTPTATPVPLTVESAYQLGDPAVIIGNTFAVWQTTSPEADSGSNRVIGSQCFPGTSVEILEIAQGDDGNLYYKVHCVLDGWVSEENLEPAG